MKKQLIILYIMLATILGAQEIKTITVTGIGELYLNPNAVVISTGVDSRDPLIGEAIKKNSLAMTSIVNGLIKLGILEDNIKTSNYYVGYYEPYNKDENEIAEYRVSNTISITILEIEKLDIILNKLVDLGINKINGVDFKVINISEYNNVLTEKAIKNAREKAEYLASLENMKVDSVLHIIEEGSQYTPVMAKYNMNLAYGESDRSLSSGNELITKTYTVTYQISSK
ncbi:MAG: SIMPL domain-containing protein [Candidatus Delongbacteria bacterium]|nr:SIMPL domain-containing protein [Candidatus Delongbacteria bacterium]